MSLLLCLRFTVSRSATLPDIFFTKHALLPNPPEDEASLQLGDSKFTVIIGGGQLGPAIVHEQASDSR